MNVTLFVVWLNIVEFKCLQVLFYNTHPFPLEWVSRDFHSVKPGVWFFILDSLILGDHKIWCKRMSSSQVNPGENLPTRKSMSLLSCFSGVYSIHMAPGTWYNVVITHSDSFPLVTTFLVCVSQNSMNIITNWWSFKNHVLFNALLGSQLFHFSSFYLLISAS